MSGVVPLFTESLRDMYRNKDILLVLLLLLHHHHYHHHHYPGYSSRFSDLLCAGRYWFGIPVGQEIFLLRGAKIETGGGGHSGSNSIGTGSSFSRNKAGQGAKLTTHSQLVPWFRMSGDILLHLAYSCMAYTRVLFLLSLLLITDDFNVKFVGHSLKFYAVVTLCLLLAYDKYNSILKKKKKNYLLSCRHHSIR